jgi:hypothetical protein
VNKKTAPEGLGKVYGDTKNNLLICDIDSDDVQLATTILHTTGSKYIDELKILKLEFEQKFNIIREKYLEETKQRFFRTE